MVENHYKIVSFDMDGTLIPNTTSTLHFAELLGVKEKVYELEDEFQRGVLDSTGFMHKISSIMHGLSLDFIKNNLATLPIIDGLEHTIKTLRDNGIITVIITTSAQPYAEAIKEKFGFDMAFGTEFEIDDNGNLGRGKRVCSSANKIKFLKEIANQNKVSMDRVAAVGDSVSDIPLFTQVGMSIALNYQDCLVGKADHYYRSQDISVILSNLLTPKKEDLNIMKLEINENKSLKNGLGKIYYAHFLKSLCSNDLCTQLINDFERSADIILNSNLIFKILPDDFIRIDANFLNKALTENQYLNLAGIVKSNAAIQAHIGEAGINAINNSIEFYAKKEGYEPNENDLIHICKDNPKQVRNTL